MKRRSIAGWVPEQIKVCFLQSLKISAWPKQDAISAALYSFAKLPAVEQLTIIQEVRRKFPVEPDTTRNIPKKTKARAS